MIVRDIDDVAQAGLCVEWGGGTSHRYLTDQDKMGFTVCRTVVYPGTEARMEYKRHLEACYCIAGTGEVVTATGKTHALRPDVLYGLEKNDAHTLRNTGDTDLVLLSVFNPPLIGSEVHNLSDTGYSGY